MPREAAAPFVVVGSIRVLASPGFRKAISSNVGCVDDVGNGFLRKLRIDLALTHYSFSTAM